MGKYVKMKGVAQAIMRETSEEANGVVKLPLLPER
ncbi:hypothetical protein QO009_003850 [Brevibacillus aydinogluensis]|jgi:hypothetical protein|uniref:Uncharacterized protein n=1 Tax=Brevibacillus aydinogluensis TaxID=927786 RepID=A0AA48MAS6_9BACL|nr:hypothetical protein [Brevibacillus aydinogluensis]CAJ1003795.1 hypothetical protein BSPP4475_15845 [Brevibacillus aydinogluensis]